MTELLADQELHHILLEVVGVLLAGVLIGMIQISRQLTAIHELVNSNLTKAQTDLALADARIRVLEEHIAHEPGGASNPR